MEVHIERCRWLPVRQWLHGKAHFEQRAVIAIRIAIGPELPDRSVRHRIAGVQQHRHMVCLRKRVLLHEIDFEGADLVVQGPHLHSALGHFLLQLDRLGSRLHTGQIFELLASLSPDAGLPEPVRQRATHRLPGIDGIGAGIERGSDFLQILLHRQSQSEEVEARSGRHHWRLSKLVDPCLRQFDVDLLLHRQARLRSQSGRWRRCGLRGF